MELDELKAAWNELGSRLDQKQLELSDLRRQNALGMLRSRMRLVTRGQIVQLLIGVVFCFWGGSFWHDHLGVAHLVAYGLGLHAYGLALLGTAVIQLVRLKEINYFGSVAQVQQSILQLKRSRIRGEQVMLIAGGVGWVPILFIALYRLGFDVWMYSPDTVLWNLAAGIAVSAGLAWASLKYPDWLDRSANGGRLHEVEQQLRDLGEFARD